MCVHTMDASDSSIMETCCKHKMASLDARDECSTVASDSEPEDLEISDDEMINDRAVASSLTQTSSDVPRRTRWADLVDSDEERELHGALVKSQAASAEENSTAMQEIFQTALKKKSARVQWADLVDSDTEDERMAPIARISERAIAVELQRATIEDSGESDTMKARGELRSAKQTADKPAPKSVEKRRKGLAKGEGKGKAGQKGSGKGAAKGSGKGSGNNVNGKQQCQFIIGIEEDRHFRVVKRIIGVQGANMKRIADETGAKLRLRGRGSKFLEGPEKKESTDDLMLCLSSQDKAGYADAVRLVFELLQGIYDDYAEFCRTEGKRSPSLCVRMHEGYREGSR